MKFELREVARMLGMETEARGMVTGWSIDSRTIERGDLFFALRGPNHDGHDHIAEVFQKGAAGVVVEHEVDAEGAIFRVADSLAALQKIAHIAREKWAGS